MYFTSDTSMCICVIYCFNSVNTTLEISKGKIWCFDKKKILLIYLHKIKIIIIFFDV